MKLPKEAVALLHTDWHANSIALGVQQASNLSEVAVSLPVILIHGGLQKEGIVGIQHPGNSLFCALYKHTWLLGIHVIPHALVSLIARILGKEHKDWEKRKGHVGFKRKGIKVGLKILAFLLLNTPIIFNNLSPFHYLSTTTA